MIRRRLVDIALGLLVFLLVMIAEFVVTLPEGTPAQTPWPTRAGLNHEFLLAAGPALLIAALVAFGSHTRSVRQGLRRGVTWLVVLGVLYLAIGLGNGTTMMFATVGMWLMLAAVVAGGVAGGWLGARRAAQAPGANDSAPLRTRLT